MEVLGPVMMVLFAMVAVIAIVYGAMADRKRAQELQGWAYLGGWSFDPSKRTGARYPGSIFDQGHSRYSRFHMTRALDDATPGLDDASADLFEYHYAITTSNGKTTQTHHYYFTCIAIDAGCDLGSVMIRDEHWGDKIFQSIGFDDIDLEDPEFSRRFVVKAPTRKDAYDLLGHAMMRYLSKHGGWRIETRGRLLLIYDRGRMHAQDCHRLEQFAIGLLAQLPRTLVNAERERRGLPPIMEAGAASRESRASLTQFESELNTPDDR